MSTRIILNHRCWPRRNAKKYEKKDVQTPADAGEEPKTKKPKRTASAKDVDGAKDVEKPKSKRRRNQ